MLLFQEGFRAAYFRRVTEQVHQVQNPVYLPVLQRRKKGSKAAGVQCEQNSSPEVFVDGLHAENG